MNYQQIKLTGNPFVDTGLAVISCLGGLDDMAKLTTKVVHDVFGNGDDLARWNSRLKSFSQVFGTNNPLFQNAYGYTKSSGPSPLNNAIYQQTLKNFLENVDDHHGQIRCEACGNLTNLDFAAACTSAIETNGEKAPDTKWVGRDWFPLAGSLGSDAQALPAASRAAHICPLGLFAVHYLPVGVTLVEGRLTVFQSTSAEFWYELITNIVHDIQGRINAGNYDTLGAKEGSRALAKRLLGLFEQLQKAERFARIPLGTTLFVWRFSNAGASPDCALEEIPSPALVFLWKAVEQGFRNEIERFIEGERNPEYSLLRCISERRDYPALYPKGKSEGAGPRLFCLYQVEVRARTARTLSIAQKLAYYAHQTLTTKDLTRLQREGIFEQKFQDLFRQLMVRMCGQGEFILRDYLELFPLIEQDSGIQVSSDGWNLIRFFLHHPDVLSSTVPNGPLNTEIYQQGARINLLRYCAACIFDNSEEKSKTDVLNRMSRGDIRTAWLQAQFVKLAESRQCFTFATWSTLSKRPDGQTSTAEVLFQMRLLWIEWNAQPNIPAVAVSYQDYSGLPATVEDYLKNVATIYVKNRGINRFQRDILVRLRRREIGMQWFKGKLASGNEHFSEDRPFLTEDQWNNLFKDDEGRNIVVERLFQMHLVLANYYRNQTQINEGVTNGQ